MARVSTYLNFPGTTEEAFNFYEAVFNSKITSLTRMGDMPWGAYWGLREDKFGILWMISFAS